MAGIQILDKHTINKIAAGEVVESPKSVVKELTENAIDAGATAITVEIREGGISYIRITDNGCGIAKEEVKTAFLRHATSKLTQIEDLEHIYTMGFRGEALASIAAVAQVEMITRTKAEEIGTKIELAGGEIQSIQDVACQQGTTVIVKNLFYNVPARHKFLKKPSKEGSYVSELIHQLSLGHTEISFRYINNDTTLLHTSGNGDIKATLFYVYGKQAAKSMMEISIQKGAYRLTGMIGKPEFCRGNRGYENLFINGRYIKNKIVSSAVEDAYKTRMMVGKFPVYVLYLEVDAAKVDVNVHPAKLEVRFDNDNEVYDFFYEAICSVFEGQVLIPTVNWDKKEEQQKESEEKKEPSHPIQTEQTQQKVTEHIQIHSDLLSDSQNQKQNNTCFKNNVQQNTVQTQQPYTKSIEKNTISKPLHETEQHQNRVQQIAAPYIQDFEIEVHAKEQEIAKQKTHTFFHQYRIIGQLFRTYWLVEQQSSFYVIDQHAAHERILYETFMTQFKNETIISQKLVMPMIFRLSPIEQETLQENIELFGKFGFMVTQIDKDQYGLEAVPVLLGMPSNPTFFIEILDVLSDSAIHHIYDTKIGAVANMACKAAVKAHDKLDIQEAEAMIVQLLSLENPFTCPHGRPTIIELTKYELEKKFKRIQN